jgi:hypothetical protein
MNEEHRDTVTVTFNGSDREVGYQPHATVQALLQHAKQAFGLEGAPNQHLLGLFTEAGVELNDQLSAQDAGIKPGELLVLRPSTVRGGA